jgi:hypothetical protein
MYQLCYRAGQFSGKLFCCKTVALRDEKYEFVSPHARDFGSSANPAKAYGKALDYPVATRVTKRIIYFFETVYVDPDHGERFNLVCRGETLDRPQAAQSIKKSGEGVYVIHGVCSNERAGVPVGMRCMAALLNLASRSSP